VAAGILNLNVVAWAALGSCGLERLGAAALFAWEQALDELDVQRHGRSIEGSKVSPIYGDG
jgi:hypothetical protein